MAWKPYAPSWADAKKFANPMDQQFYDVTNSIRNYQTRLGAMGQPLPPQKNFLDYLDPIFKVLDLLDRPRNATMVALTGEGNFWEGLTAKKRVDFQDLLPEDWNPTAKFALGWIGDVLTDPTTYLTLGTGSVAKGLATGMKSNLGEAAAKLTAKDLLTDTLSDAIKKGASYAGLDKAMLGGIATTDDAIKTLSRLADNGYARDVIEHTLSESRLKDLMPSLTAFSETNKIGYGDMFRDKFDDVAKLINDHIGTQADDYGATLMKDFEKLSGKGLGIDWKIPFTGIDFGRTEFISGAKMQEWGANLAEKMRYSSKVDDAGKKVLRPLIGAPSAFVQDFTQKVFNKYALPKASEKVKQYARLKDIQKMGNVDLSNTEAVANLKRYSKGTALAGYDDKLDEIVAAYKKDPNLAIEMIASMEDSEFKRFIQAVGTFQGEPLTKVGYDKITKGIKSRVYTYISEDEVDAFLKDGLSATVKDKDGIDQLRYLGYDPQEVAEVAKQTGKGTYIVTVDNIGSDATGNFERLKKTLAGETAPPPRENIYRPENTLQIFKVNPEGTTIDDILEDAKDYMDEKLQKEFSERGQRWFKPEPSKVSLGILKPHIREGVRNGEAVYLVPQLTESGRIKRNTYNVFQNGELIETLDAEDMEQAYKAKKAAEKQAAAARKKAGLGMDDMDELDADDEMAITYSKEVMDEWNYGDSDEIGEPFSTPQQEITSDKTSRPQIPASLKKIKWKPGAINADIGGGKYELATNFLKEKGVTNVIWDPFNRDAEHNAKALKLIKDGKADTVTVNNVLNVIQNKKNRRETILNAYNALKDDGEAYFLMYQGNKSGIGGPTSDGWQAHRAYQSYLDEIKEYFPYAKTKDGMIVARKTIGNSTDDIVVPRADGRGQGKIPVGKVIGGQVYIHKNYAKKAIPEDVLNQAEVLLKEQRPDFKYNTIMYDKKKGVVRFDEALDFDTASEPTPGKFAKVYLNDGKVEDGFTKNPWHHKWKWVEDDYEGFGKDGVRKARLWSQKYMSVLPKGVSPNGSQGIEGWKKQLKEYGIVDDINVDERAMSVDPRVEYVKENPKFKEWFGDSKVVDEDGNPAVQYHFTDVRTNFAKFASGQLGIHVGSSDQAMDIWKRKNGGILQSDSRLLKEMESNAKRGYMNRTYPVFVNIKNPVDIRDMGSWNADDVAWELSKKGVFEPEDYVRYRAWYDVIDARIEGREFSLDDAIEEAKEITSRWGSTDWDALKAKEKEIAAWVDEYRHTDMTGEGILKQLLKDKGYDGFRYKNKFEGKGEGISWMAFDGSQIKSATGNSGNFDPNDMDIRALDVDPEVQKGYYPDVESINKKVWYHGTGTKGMTAQALDSNATDLANLFGQGIYLTDTPDIAEGYAKARGKKTGTPLRYSARINVGKMIDLEAPLPDDALNPLKDMAKQLDESYGTDFAEYIDDLIDDGEDGYNVYGSFLKYLKKEAGYAEISKNELYDYFDELLVKWREAGYDGFTHIGGKITKGDEHQVAILFDPNDFMSDVGRKNQVTKFDALEDSKTRANNGMLEENTLGEDPWIEDSRMLGNAENASLDSWNPELAMDVDPMAEKMQKLQEYGFNDYEDFKNRPMANPFDPSARDIGGGGYGIKAPKPNFDLTGIQEMYKELGKGIDDKKWDAMSEILESPEKLYGDLNTPVEKGLRAVGVLLQERLRLAGFEEKNIGMLKSVLDDYIPHVMNWDKVKEKASMSGPNTTRNLNTINLHNLPREYKTTIAEANQIMEQMGYGKNYFETNFAKAYITRMIRHNKVIFDDQYVKRLLGGAGYEVARNTPMQIVRKTIEQAGEDMKDYTLVIPRASVKIFSISNREASTFEAFLDFIENGMEFSAEASKIGKNSEAIQKVMEQLSPLADNLDDLIKRNPDAAAFVENVIKGAGDDIDLAKLAKEAKLLEGFTENDAEVLEKLSEAISGIPREAVQRFDNVKGLRGKLQNLADLEKGALAEIDEGDLEMIAAHIHDVKAYMVPKSVYSFVVDSSKKQMDEGVEAITRLIDGFNKHWKTSVTSLLPSFHVRNLLGGQHQNIMEFGVLALSPKFQGAATKIALDGEGVIKLGGKEYTYDEIRKLMIRDRVNTPFMRTSVGEMQNMYHKDFETGKWPKGLNPVEWGRTAGNFVEDEVRTTNYLIWLDKGMDPLSAAELTKSAHFDYTELSNAERKLFKRAMPFYTFFRKNFPYQIQKFLNEPGKYTTLRHLQENGQEAMGMDKENLPDWMTESFAMPLTKGKDGRDYYANLSLPAGDIVGRSVRELTAGLNPALVALFEQMANQNLLTQAPIEKYPGQTTDIKGLPVSNRILHLLDKVGVARNGINMAKNAPDGMLTNSNSFDPMSLFGIVRGYDPKRGRLNALYERQRELGNVVQRLNDRGTPVPTINDIEAQNRPYSSRVKSRGYMGY